MKRKHADQATLLVPSAAVMAVNVSLFPKMPFDPVKDFTPVTKLVTVPNMLTAHPSLPARTIPELKAGRLRGIGIGSLKRIAALPDLPTFHESGYPGFETGSWYGIVAPAGTPAAVVSLLHSETVKVLNLPEIVVQFASEDAQPVGNAPQAFTKEGRHQEMGEGDQGRGHQAVSLSSKALVHALRRVTVRIERDNALRNNPNDSRKG
jgi:tripartite-type tricarboxylate transporter receptor subunit TctC